MGANVFNFDARIFDYDFNPLKEAAREYLKMTDSGLYEAIHISQSPKHPIFKWDSTSVGKAYEEEKFEDYTNYYSYLLENNIPLLVMAGEFDQQDGPPT